MLVSLWKLGQILKSEHQGAVIFLSSCGVGASTLQTTTMELRSGKHVDAGHVKEALAFAWMHQGTHTGLTVKEPKCHETILTHYSAWEISGV